MDSQSTNQTNETNNLASPNVTQLPPRPLTKMPKFQYEVFGFIGDDNKIVTEASRDRVTLEGIPKKQLCRILIQVIET